MCKCELVHTREKSNQAIFEHRNIPWSQSWSEKLKIQNEMSSSPYLFGVPIFRMFRFEHSGRLFIV